MQWSTADIHVFQKHGAFNGFEVQKVGGIAYVLVQQNGGRQGVQCENNATVCAFTGWTVAAFLFSSFGHLVIRPMTKFFLPFLYSPLIPFDSFIGHCCPIPSLSSLESHPRFPSFLAQLLSPSFPPSSTSANPFSLTWHSTSAGKKRGNARSFLPTIVIVTLLPFKSTIVPVGSP